MALTLRSDLVPELSPDVEANLMFHLAKEVEFYSNNLSGKRCLLCPFRTFARESRLRIHLKHHCAEFLQQTCSCTCLDTIWSTVLGKRAY